MPADVDFRNEAEALDYIKQISIEYRYSCLEEKDPEGCHLLGDLQESFEKNHPAAAQTYKENCLERGWAHSCFKYGTYLQRGVVIKRSLAKAYRMFDKGCEGGFGKSCRYQADLKAKGSEKIIQDIHKAAQLYEKACDLEDALSCETLSALYITGDSKTVEQEMQRRIKQWEQSRSWLWKKLEPHFLSEKERNEQIMANQDITPYKFVKDERKAFEFTKKACDMGRTQSCLNTSKMYRRGYGTEENEQLANEYKEKYDYLRKKMNLNYGAK